jgi:hypothetical protein
VPAFPALLTRAAGAAFLIAAAAQAVGPPPTRPGEAPRPAGDSREAIREGGSGLRPHETARFSILSDIPRDRREELGRTAEQVATEVADFAARLRLTTRNPPGRMRILCFREWTGYHSAARRAGFAVDPTLPGFFDERANRCYLFDAASARGPGDSAASARGPGDSAASEPAERRRQRALVFHTVARHEIAHQVLFNLGLQSADDHGRRWLKEGMAMLFESPEQPNPHRLADFLAMEHRPAALSFRRLVGNPALIGPGAERMQQAYARAWGLVYYLSRHRPGALAEYIRSPPPPGRRGTGEAALVADFEATIGPLDVAFEDRCHRALAEAKPTTAPAEE